MHQEKNYNFQHVTSENVSRILPHYLIIYSYYILITTININVNVQPSCH